MISPLFQHKKSVFLQLLTHAQSPKLNQNYIKTITKVSYDLVSSLNIFIIFYLLKSIFFYNCYSHIFYCGTSFLQTRMTLQILFGNYLGDFFYNMHVRHAYS